MIVCLASYVKSAIVPVAVETQELKLQIVKLIKSQYSLQ